MHTTFEEGQDAERQARHSLEIGDLYGKLPLRDRGRSYSVCVILNIPPVQLLAISFLRFPFSGLPARVRVLLLRFLAAVAPTVAA